MDEIFEMIMKIARAMPGDNLKEKAFSVLDQLTDRVVHALNCGLEKHLKLHSKDDKSA